MTTFTYVNTCVPRIEESLPMKYVSSVRKSHLKKREKTGKSQDFIADITQKKRIRLDLEDNNNSKVLMMKMHLYLTF